MGKWRQTTPEKLKMVVFSAYGTQGVGILGDGRREKWGEMGKSGEEFFPISFPNCSLVSTLFPIFPHFTNMFPPFPPIYPLLFPIPPHFPPFPIFPLFPIFLGNVVGYLITAHVGDFWALMTHLSPDCTCC